MRLWFSLAHTSEPGTEHPMVATVIAKASSQGSLQPYPVKPFGLAVAIVVLGIVIFLVPPPSRLWIAGIVIVMALLQRGGDATKIINTTTEWIYGKVGT